jgi:hypothetical protein
MRLVLRALGGHLDAQAVERTMDGTVCCAIDHGGLGGASFDLPTNGAR